MTSDLEWEFIDRELQRYDQIYGYIADQLTDREIGLRPGGIIRIPAGHPLTRKPGQFD